MQGDDFLHLVWIDLETGNVDHILLAIDDAYKAIFVDRPMSPVRKKPSGVMTLAVSSGLFQ